MSLSTSRERHAHERILEALVVEALCGTDADEFTEAAAIVGVPPLFDPDGESQTVLAGSMTFEDKGMLTANRGVVLTLTDGSEFHLTIARSRNPRAED